MPWPYQFLLDLSEEDKALRHEAIGFYALVAHCSAFAPAAAFLLFRLGGAVVRRLPGGSSDDGGYQAVPGSPATKARRLSTLGGLEARWARFSWWMGEDVDVWGVNWGQRDEWVLGMAWAAWLLLLSVLGTGNDYLHLTKRFGLVAVSQLPIQYLLALKDLNPFAWVFRSSHEQVNRYHRVLGRVIYGILLLHIIFYNNFFLVAGVWTKRFFAPIVFAGVIASVGMHALFGTALSAVRRYSYRIFFIAHLTAALAVPVLVLFHAYSAELYLCEALLVFLVDLAARRWATIAAPSTLETVPGTDLIKISATLPATKLAKFDNRPGSHVYLSVPAESRPSKKLTSMSSVLYEFIFNPFTIASVDHNANLITLVARRRAGPLTSHLSNLSTSSNPTLLNILGPYGPAGIAFPSLPSRGYNRILLFAGGVGATFALPIYRAISHEAPFAQIKLIWAIRSAADATWATAAPSTGGDGSGSVLDDDNVQLYITGDMGLTDGSTDGVEMSSFGRGNHKRPDIRKVVNDAFQARQEDAIAVVVCGPVELAKDVRASVRPWVMKGRKVWWHNESFGW